MEPIILLNLIVLWAVVLLLLWLGLHPRPRAVGGRQASARTSAPKEAEPLLGQSAPDFVAWTLTHQHVTQDEYLGQGDLALFIFLSTTCPHCRNVLPEIERVGEQLLARGNKVAFVFGESAEKTQKYSQEMDLALPILIAPRDLSSFTSDYNRRGGVPAFLAIDSERKVTYEGVVNKREESWRTFVREVQAYPTLTRSAALYHD